MVGGVFNLDSVAAAAAELHVRQHGLPGEGMLSGGVVVTKAAHTGLQPDSAAISFSLLSAAGEATN